MEGPLSCSGVRNRRLTNVRKLTLRQSAGSSRLLCAHILIPTSLRAVERGCLSRHPAGVSTVLDTHCNVPEQLILHWVGHRKLYMHIEHLKRLLGLTHQAQPNSGMPQWGQPTGYLKAHHCALNTTNNQAPDPFLLWSANLFLLPLSTHLLGLRFEQDIAPELF